MSEQKNSDNKQPVTPSGTNLTRRKITKAALASPVVASLSTTPVFGCSISGFLSGNTSENHKPPTCGGNGCTPGFWKTRLDAWAQAGYSPGTCKPGTYDANNGKCGEWDVSSGDTIAKMLTNMPCGAFDVSFFGETGKDGYVYTNDTTILNILLKSIKGGGNTNSLLAHYIAAIFNASANPAIYGSSVQDIKAGLCKAYDENKMIEFKDILDALNNRGCFLDASGDCVDAFVSPDGTSCIPACEAHQYYDTDLKQCVDTPL